MPKSSIKCCMNCVHPERHTACHDTCPKYLAEKKQWEENKRIHKEQQLAVQVGRKEYDVNFVLAPGSKGRKSRRFKKHSNNGSGLGW